MTTKGERDVPVTQITDEQRTLRNRRRLEFGAAIRTKRKALGLSQEKLAERALCDRQSINRTENGAYAPSLDRVFWMADALGCDPADLFPVPAERRRTA